MSIRFLQRDMTESEFEQVEHGFERLAAQAGLRTPARKRLTVVAERERVFVGCATGLTHHNWFYITDLWVEDEMRGRGLGRAMLERLEALVVAEGIRRAFLWTSGHEARAFYAKLNYRVFAELEDFYSLGITRYGYRKELTGAM